MASHKYRFSKRRENRIDDSLRFSYTYHNGSEWRCFEEDYVICVIMTKKIHIKKNAWIGARANILPGVTIGENAIIGTGSIQDAKTLPKHFLLYQTPYTTYDFRHLCPQ